MVKSPSAVHGFTMIEMLVVISIMAVLSGLILAAVNLFGFGSKREQSNAVLATLRTAIEMNLAERGAAMAPAEHPLAGSKAPRLTFVRSDGSTAVAGGGFALRGVAADQVHPVKRARVLVDSDLFADPRVPALFGMPRGRLGVMGVPQASVTAYRRLPATISTADDPDDAASFPPFRHDERPDGSPEQTKLAMDHLFGSGNMQSELLGLGALTGPGAEFAVSDFVDSEFDGRVVSSVAMGGGIGSPQWKPGHLRDGTIPSGPAAGEPNWKPYRLRGMAIYDAWGSEVLYSMSGNGGIRLESAGLDGCFRWHPGEDGVLQTAADAELPAGDDEDASRDNLFQVVGD